MLYLYDEKSCKLTTSKVENFRWASAAVENSLVFFMHWRSDWSRTSIRCQPQDVASSYYISVPRWWHQEGKVTLKGRTTRLERLIDLILAADGSPSLCGIRKPQHLPSLKVPWEDANLSRHNSVKVSYLLSRRQMKTWNGWLLSSPPMPSLMSTVSSVFLNFCSRSWIAHLNAHPNLVILLFLNFWISFQPIGLYSGKYEWAARPGTGDCSLNILAIDIKFDDGLWECQVTASAFEAQDALASKPARLVVRGKAIIFQQQK